MSGNAKEGGLGRAGNKRCGGGAGGGGESKRGEGGDANCVGGWGARRREVERPRSRLGGGAGRAVTAWAESAVEAMQRVRAARDGTG